jgi:hypothetical protein
MRRGAFRADPERMELVVLHDTVVRRTLAVAVAAAGLVWAAAWGFGAQAADGSRLVLGLGEGEWRAVLNPALATTLLAAIVTLPLRARLPARAAASALLLAGLALVLGGNLLEFGLDGARQPTANLGWATFIAGWVTTALGAGTLAATSIPFRRPRPLLRATLAPAGTLLLITAAIAVPAAVAMLATVLVDALLTRAPAPAEEPLPIPLVRATSA